MVERTASAHLLKDDSRAEIELMACCVTQIVPLWDLFTNPRRTQFIAVDVPFLDNIRCIVSHSYISGPALADKCGTEQTSLVERTANAHLLKDDSRAEIEFMACCVTQIVPLWDLFTNPRRTQFIAVDVPFLDNIRCIVS
ncbi:unnamed protein product [Strongylus vulgaris]|uniref:Uncharacterized protein n=1 Tax=Strongylus vulgaris TaxID=40348 RepID=A0A3P7JE53_STRVU|nr:unnamed protein product [Strongylus vulgaris]